MTDKSAEQKDERDLRTAGTLLSIESTALDDVTVLRVSGEVDVLTAPQLRAAIDDALAGNDDRSARGIAVDLQAVTFLASSGLSVLGAEARPNPQDRRIVIVANHSAVLRPMQLTGLVDLLTVCPTVAEACAELRTARSETA
ncbi:anti-sigma factor antagonist [Nocardia sp. NPDC050712]|uniref:anti-sigma factor antagonist n=1 Tax=Nocardia sp. NPDC050712 TaxID=3155518 RepID=UPI0033C6BF16